MRNATHAKIGKSKVVHAYYAWCTRTDCGAGGMGDVEATEVDGPITCKRCLKSLAVHVEADHAAAIVEDGVRETVKAVAPSATYVTIQPVSSCNPTVNYIVTTFAEWARHTNSLVPIKGEAFATAAEAEARKTDLNPCGGTGCAQDIYPRPHKPSCPQSTIDRAALFS